MKRILAAAVLLAFMPTANAADKKSEFSTDAEYRVRYMLTQNQSGDENTIPADSSEFTHRFKLGVNYRANEKMSAHLTLLHNKMWGQQPSTTTTTYTDTPGGDTVDITTEDRREDDLFLVNEAYGWWGISDDFSAKIGRQNFSFGDGSIWSVNDWEPTPYAFDGVSMKYEMEAGSITAWGFKIAELSGVNGVSGAGDPEHNNYGVSFDLKTMPEVLKMVNVHVTKDNRNTAPDTTAANGPLDNELGQDLTRYGATVGGAAAGVDFKVTYEKVDGDYLFQDTQGADVQKADGAADMMEATVGYGVESFMKSHFSVTYHKDSGTADTSGTDMNKYSGYFHEQHCSAGCMDLLDFGNLTFWALNAKLSPMDNTTVGLGYYMFKMTETNATAANADSPTDGTNAGSLWTGGDGSKDDLGSEIDLWAEHNYDNGLSTMARIGYFTPGDYISSTTGGDKSDKVMQFFLQAKMTF